MANYTAALLLGLVVKVSCAPAVYAHHGNAAYDMKHTLTRTGTVTQLTLGNPHSLIAFDAKDENGNVTSWKAEGFPPNMLIRQGWRRDVTVKVGDTISVFGWRARDSSNLMQSREVTLSDGRKLLSGPPAGTGGGN